MSSDLSRPVADDLFLQSSYINWLVFFCFFLFGLSVQALMCRVGGWGGGGKGKIKFVTDKTLVKPRYILNLSDEPPVLQLLLCKIMLKDLQCTDLKFFIMPNQRYFPFVTKHREELLESLDTKDHPSCYS